VTRGKLHLFAICVVILVLGSGCAKDDLVRKDLDALRSQMVEMQKSIADTNLRMEELSNSIFILQERSKANTAALKDVAQPRIVISQPAESFLAPPTNAPLPQGPVTSPNVGAAAIKSSVGTGLPVRQTGPVGGSAYASARASYSMASYGLAVFDFSAFLASHPSNSNAEQARYYLGMSYFKLNEYAQAAREFTQYLSDYPSGSRAAEVTYMAGLAYNAAGQPSQAKTFFDLTQKKYAGTPWATKAAQALTP
jgi:TolA-binding protein